MGQRTATVKLGVSGSPYIMIHHYAPAGGMEEVPLAFSYKKLVDLMAKGYTVDDPQQLVTCHCGALMDYGQMECDACSGEALDWQSECQTQSDLIGGM